MMENPMKVDDLGVPPFMETPMFFLCYTIFNEATGGRNILQDPLSACVRAMASAEATKSRLPGRKFDQKGIRSDVHPSVRLKKHGIALGYNQLMNGINSG